MLTPSLNTVMTRLLIVAAVVTTLIIIVAPAISAQEAPMMVDYKENGTGAVITFTSTDPENGTPGAGIDWDVTGTDADDFVIDASGTLMFVSPPDYEEPTDRANDRGTPAPATDDDYDAKMNSYEITVRATEQMTDGDDIRSLSTETHVTVMVQDLNEVGKVTFNRLQPEVGSEITAMLNDPDGVIDTNGEITGTDPLVTLGYQWYVSKVSTPLADEPNHWVMATGEGTATAIYIPAGDRIDKETPLPNDNNAPVDEDKMLRVVVTYLDMNRQQDAADAADMVRRSIAVVENPVRAEVSSDLDVVENPENGSPGFSTANDYTRSISESAGKGSLVVGVVEATDPNGDTLTYELDNDRFLASDDTNNVLAAVDDDVHFFNIDQASGQLSLAEKLDADSGDGKYLFHVRATDPSGETAEVEVTVTAMQANDAPEIEGSSIINDQGEPVDDQNAVRTSMPEAPSELRVFEKDDDTGADPYDGNPGLIVPGVLGKSNVFTANDEDARGQIVWSLSGVDMDDFDITNTSADPETGLRGPGEPVTLQFKNDPDYEAPTDDNMDGVYKVTLIATDSTGASDERPLTIFVDNVHEQGEIVLSTGQPLIGHSVTASVSDPDNGVAIITWQWSRSETAGGTFEAINGATTDTYTPKSADDGYFLRATATYLDMTSESDDPDTPDVDERTQEDDGGGDISAKVPVMTDGDGIAADGTPVDEDSVYRQMETSVHAVRFVPAPPDDPDAPVFAASSYDRSVTENAEVGSIVGLPVQVDMTDEEEGTTFSYNIDSTITGDDEYFDIDTASGQIRVGEVDFPDPVPADLEVPADTVTTPGKLDPTLDYEGTNTFTLIVTAKQDGNTGRTATASVTVTLDNLNERPYFDKASREDVDSAIEYFEHRTNPVVQLAAFEPDGTDLNWVVTGPDADDFEIMDADDINDGKDRVHLVFRSQPDFESPTDRVWDVDGEEGIEDLLGIDGEAGTDGVPDEGRGDNMYQVTVRATEDSVAVGSGPKLAAELPVTVTVANSDDPGAVSFTLRQPEVGTALTASVFDPDDGVTGEGWTWWRAKVRKPNENVGTTDTALAVEWEQITTATDPAYTPQGVDADAADPANAGNALDEGWHLLARVQYTDTHGAGKAVVALSATTTRADVSNVRNNSPDFNRNETTRSIDEDAAVGTAIGEPVDVDRNEDGDLLTYSFVTVPADNPDANDVDDDFFSIDWATGQISVKKRLSAEAMTDGRTYTGTDAATAGEYVVVVRAIDPSGDNVADSEEDRDDITVTITANDVNEAPGVEGAAELSVYEANSTSDNFYVGLGNATNTDDAIVENANDGNLYHRSEEDLVDLPRWPDKPIPGADGRFFEYSVPSDGIGRRLHFKEAPNYEDPKDADGDNVYEVMVTVFDSDNAMGQQAVRITVMNAEEDGTLTLSPDDPNAGSPVEARITDPDSPDGVIVTNWKWAATTGRVGGFGDATPIETATMYKYTGMQGEFLWAMVEYRDGASVEDDPVTVLDERNDDPDTEPVEQHKLTLDQNDDGVIDDSDRTGDTLDHNSDETRSKGTDNAVQAAPPPPPPPPGTPVDVVAIVTSVKENIPATGYVGIPLDDLLKAIDKDMVLAPRDNIGGPDGAAFVLAEEKDLAADRYYDPALTSQDDQSDPPDKGTQLALGFPVTDLDFEGGKTTYTIEVTEPNAATAISTVRVTINVLDVNERPTAPSELRGMAQPLNSEPMFLDDNGDVATSTYRMVAENSAAGTDVGDPVVATDSDRGDQDTLVYTLGGADMASFTIDSATGQLSTSAPLDFETKSEFMVTVTATDDDDASSMIYVTIMVTDVGLGTYDGNEDGTIDSSEVLKAVADYFAGDIDAPTVLGVVAHYFAGL